MVRLVGLDSIYLCDLEGNGDKMIIKALNIILSVAAALFIYTILEWAND